jgi:hypothetical protein
VFCEEVICMEMKLVALVLASVLVGLVGGYGLGYVIYQPQIQNLQVSSDALNSNLQEVNSTVIAANTSVLSIQTDLERLNSTVREIENKTWHSVTNFTLSSDTSVSPLFFVKGEKWRIKWGPPEGTTWTSSWHSFIIYNDNAQVIDEFNVDDVLARGHESTGCYFAASGDGSYCIEVTGLSTTPNRVSFTIESYC